MESLAVRCVSVWPDALAPEGGAFAHAMEWAACLGLPLRMLAEPLRGRDGQAGGGPYTVPPEVLEACAAACARRRVSWDPAPGQGVPGAVAEPVLRPSELWVFSADLQPALKDELLRRSLRSPRTSVLVCPRSWEPVSRVLILHEEHNPGNGFLESAADLCTAFGVTPVVLSVGRFEREARLRQQLAQETFAARRLAADFDLIAGCEVRAAVAAVARWRRCSHVFVERHSAPPWWRWLRGDTVQRLLGLSDWLTFLALPCAGQRLPPPSEAVPDPSSGKATKTR